MKGFLLSTLVGFGLALMPLVAGALTPVEGLLLGEAVTDIQTDPLSLVFTSYFTADNPESAEFQKMKFYQALQREGVYFNAQCSILGPSTYSSPHREQEARRSIAATLQYLGLDLSIRAIGAYARVLEVDQTQYDTIVDNVVSNYCSENVTVFSLKTIRASLRHYYQNPDPNILPTVDQSPYVTDAFKGATQSQDTRSREMFYALKNFRAFCSWGGDSADYRMLPPYLKNPFIMSLVTRHLSGSRFVFDPQKKKMVWSTNDPEAVRVGCRDLICRQTSAERFEREFPTSTGSTGINTDLNKLWCGHFRYLDYDQKKTIPEVREWMKSQELEDPYLEANFFLSLVTRIPDPFFSVTFFSDVPVLVKSSVDERWSKWAKDSLAVFSRDLLYEESLRVKAEPRRLIADVREDLMLDFHVTLGEMDRLMKVNDKIGMSFDFRFSKSYLKSLITRWNNIANNLDTEGEKALKDDITRYVAIQLRTKEKLFTQKVWNEDFPGLIAEELLAQVLSYRGGFFEDNRDEMITVPVRFSYGVFALSYLRYRNLVAKGATKLNL